MIWKRLAIKVQERKAKDATQNHLRGDTTLSAPGAIHASYATDITVYEFYDTIIIYEILSTPLNSPPQNNNYWCS